MTKKLIVIILSVVLCLAVVGGCFALYKVEGNMDIHFGTAAGVRLQTKIAGGGSTLTFEGVDAKLSPAKKSVSQDIELAISGGTPAELAGMSGQLTVKMTGENATSLVLSVTCDGAAQVSESENTSSFEKTFPLADLPTNVKITVSLPDEITDVAFAENYAAKTTSITVSWKVVDWAPEVGAYYIVTKESGWAVNQKAIKMNAPTAGSTDLAQWTGTLPAGTQFKCVKYNAAGAEGLTWYDLKYTGGWGSPAEIDVYGDGEGGVYQVDGNMCAPSEEIFVCVNTDKNDTTKHYSWGQTVASKNKTPAV